ncbi:hypothetical protein IR009_13845 [Pseudomonas putida]|uniref:hypothetical protein n=1 Tax=Pseudomonas putida TaxID=303 RepID=UPI0018AB20E9|nr:hypothetical protein [Pseudomonas putida]MBF8766304.1 hypothetical protein [Pseudomonas putida]
MSLETSHHLKSDQEQQPLNTPAFRKGDKPGIKTTIILSAPGQREKAAKRPAAGQTGKTLQAAIGVWHRADPVRFPSDQLDDYTIMNSVSKVHYMELTRTTEGTEAEVREPQNLERIRRELSDSTTVVALGKKAQLAIRESGFSGTMYTASHPSLRSLNITYKSDKSTPSEKSQDRIGQWAADVLKNKHFQPKLS